MISATPSAYGLGTFYYAPAFGASNDQGVYNYHSDPSTVRFQVGQNSDAASRLNYQLSVGYDQDLWWGFVTGLHASGGQYGSRRLTGVWHVTNSTFTGELGHLTLKYTGAEAGLHLGFKAFKKHRLDIIGGKAVLRNQAVVVSGQHMETTFLSAYSRPTFFGAAYEYAVFNQVSIQLSYAHYPGSPVNNYVPAVYTGGQVVQPNAVPTLNRALLALKFNY